MHNDSHSVNKGYFDRGGANIAHKGHLVNKEDFWLRWDLLRTRGSFSNSGVFLIEVGPIMPTRIIQWMIGFF